VLNCDKSGIKCDKYGVNGNKGHQSSGYVSLFHQPTRHESGSALQNANIHDKYDKNEVSNGVSQGLGCGLSSLSFNVIYQMGFCQIFLGVIPQMT
jgi:hypothetical protein